MAGRVPCGLISGDQSRSIDSRQLEHERSGSGQEWRWECRKVGVMRDLGGKFQGLIGGCERKGPRVPPLFLPCATG